MNKWIRDLSIKVSSLFPPVHNYLRASQGIFSNAVAHICKYLELLKLLLPQQVVYASANLIPLVSTSGNLSNSG